MFGLLKSNKNHGAHSTRRTADKATATADAAVLQALQNAARRSSPHRAAVRAEIARAIAIVESATMGLSHIRELVDEIEGLCRSALESADGSNRGLLADRYETVLSEIDAIAKATGHSGVHLIDNSRSSLTVRVAKGNEIRMSLPHVTLTTGPRGLALPRVAKAFASEGQITALAEHLSVARSRLDKASQLFRDHASDLSKRLALVLSGAEFSQDDLKNVPEGPLPQTH